MMDVMVDLETLSTQPDAVILSIGAVTFDPFTKEEPSNPFYTRLTIDDQLEMDRHIDETTIAWWGKQSKEAQDAAFGIDGEYDPERRTLGKAMDLFHKWAFHHEGIWSLGSIFDIIILENVYRQLGKHPAWGFYDIRDVRTMFKLGIDPKMNSTDKHNSLADAYYQAIGIQNVIAELGLGR